MPNSFKKSVLEHEKIKHKGFNFQPNLKIMAVFF
ncbi:hypothetical protein PEDI_22880 [Persicobacter diffluens]|uniref:Uncharacterized protein n=1 Tax=Persicobacter diffluens TaxID=981 RepID=A0AAN5ALT2_9BACT|nr:hypothetical protein PEDI_22880 [Persicobacter diffluens]